MRSGGSRPSTPRIERGRRAGSATLVYDADCRGCSRFAFAVRAVDLRGRVSLASMHDPLWEARLRPRLGPAYDEAFHLVLEPGGEVRSGPRALHALAGLLPVWPLADFVFSMPGLRALPGALYGAFARARTCATRDKPA